MAGDRTERRREWEIAWSANMVVILRNQKGKERRSYHVIPRTSRESLYRILHLARQKQEEPGTKLVLRWGGWEMWGPYGQR